MRERLATLQRSWQVMTIHERFEQIVAFLLALSIGAVVLVALGSLLGQILNLVAHAEIRPTEHGHFQEVFSGILTLLIAMEFMHSIVHWAIRGESIIHLRTVLAIALLALARKYIILDPDDLSAFQIVALAGSVLALGVVYWLLRPDDPREAG